MSHRFRRPKLLKSHSLVHPIENVTIAQFPEVHIDNSSSTNTNAVIARNFDERILPEGISLGTPIIEAEIIHEPRPTMVQRFRNLFKNTRRIAPEQENNEMPEKERLTRKNGRGRRRRRRSRKDKKKKKKSKKERK